MTLKQICLFNQKLYAPNKGDSAFWVDFDWNLAAEAGMKRMGLPYSGKYDFIETEMYWPVNHMVAPKDQSLDCNACHISENGRLAGMDGFYIPGRDSNSWVDLFGKLLFWGSLLGVFIHALARFINSLRKNEVESEEISI